MRSADTGQSQREPVLELLDSNQGTQRSESNAEMHPGNIDTEDGYARPLNIIGIKQTYLLLFVMVTTLSAIEILLFLPFEPQFQHIILIAACLTCQACWLYSPKMPSLAVHYLLSVTTSLLVCLAFIYCTFSHLPELHVLPIAGFALTLMWLITLTGIEKWQSAIVAVVLVSTYLFTLFVFTGRPFVDVFVIAAILSFTVVFSIATNGRSIYEEKEQVYLDQENAVPVEVVEKLIYLNDDEYNNSEVSEPTEVTEQCDVNAKSNGVTESVSPETAAVTRPAKIPTLYAEASVKDQVESKSITNAHSGKHESSDERRISQEENKRHWADIIQKLNEELVETIDSDLLFNRMLLFVENYIEFDAAAVGMLQDRALEKIITFGDENLCEDQTLAWDSALIRKLASGVSGINRKQAGISNVESESIYRLDVPLLSNNKIVGIVTMMRNMKNFSNFEMNLAFNVVFQSMLSLCNARLNEETKIEGTSAKSEMLCSREQFADIARRELERLDEQRGISLLILEIDHFEMLLEKYGRSVSEAVYSQMANTLLANIRASDYLGRYGQEGFTCLICDASEKTAKKLSLHLKEALIQTECKTTAGKISTTATIGIASAPKDGRDVKSLLRQADINLFAVQEG